jgi:1-acyl-sn-glycerol-3-phosphate acyltransferase
MKTMIQQLRLCIWISKWPLFTFFFSISLRGSEKVLKTTSF